MWPFSIDIWANFTKKEKKDGNITDKITKKVSCFDRFLISSDRSIGLKFVFVKIVNIFFMCIPPYVQIVCKSSDATTKK